MLDEFPTIFVQYLPHLAQERLVNFHIALVPDLAPQAQRAFRMNPVSQAELRRQTD